MKRRAIVIPLVVLAISVLVAVFAPVLAPFDPDKVSAAGVRWSGGSPWRRASRC